MNDRPDTVWEAIAMFLTIALVFAFVFVVLSGWLP